MTHNRRDTDNSAQLPTFVLGSPSTAVTKLFTPWRARTDSLPRRGTGGRRLRFARTRDHAQSRLVAACGRHFCSSRTGPPHSRDCARGREWGIGSCLLRPRRHFSPRGPAASGRLQETSRRTTPSGATACLLLRARCVAWVSATAGAISIPHSLPTTGDQDHAHRAAKPAAENGSRRKCTNGPQAR